MERKTTRERRRDSQVGGDGVDSGGGGQRSGVTEGCCARL